MHFIFFDTSINNPNPNIKPDRGYFYLSYFKYVLQIILCFNSVLSVLLPAICWRMYVNGTAWHNINILSVLLAFLKKNFFTCFNLTGWSQAHNLHTQVNKEECI